MQFSEILTLQALSQALTQLDCPLDPATESKIVQCVKQLRQIVQQCPPLQEQFDKALMELHNNHQNQTRHAVLLDRQPSSQEPQQKLSAFLRESPLFGADLDLSRNNRVNVP